MYLIFLETNVLENSGKAITFSGTEEIFRGKPANRILDPLPENYKEKYGIMVSPPVTVNSDPSKLTEIWEK